MRTLAQIIAIALLFCASIASATLSASSREILAVASKLGTEGEDARIRRDLEAFPRAKVIAAVREGLLEGGAFAVVAARAANALHVTEVATDLEKTFQKNQDWSIALALASLAAPSQKSKLAQTWQAKLASFESPTRLAILQTLTEWKSPLSSALFNSLLEDESSQVRIAAVRNFTQTKEKLALSDAIARYKKAFALKPYQARLEAMAEFALLSKIDHARYAPAIDETFKANCKKEDKPDVKHECERIVKGAK